METLFDVPAPDEYRVSNRLLEPDLIELVPTDKTEFVRFQRRMSSANWNPAPGRFMPFLLKHEDAVIGLLNLNTPVMNLGPRDKYLGLDPSFKIKGKQLRQYADMGTCIGAQPLAWHWNLGKLIAMIAPTLGDYWYDKYGDEMLGVTTTSVYGRSSQYNRVWKHLGYTQGHGHEHISDEEYESMTDFLKERDAMPDRRGRMDTIQQYRKVSGDKSVTTFHGRQRGIYYHPALPPEERDEQIAYWYGRWGLPRYERTKDKQPPYDTSTDPTKEYKINEKAR